MKYYLHAIWLSEKDVSVKVYSSLEIFIRKNFSFVELFANIEAKKVCGYTSEEMKRFKAERKTFFKKMQIMQPCKIYYEEDCKYNTLETVEVFTDKKEAKGIKDFLWNENIFKAARYMERYELAGCAIA